MEAHQHRTITFVMDLPPGEIDRHGYIEPCSVRMPVPKIHYARADRTNTDMKAEAAHRHATVAAARKGLTRNERC